MSQVLKESVEQFRERKRSQKKLKRKEKERQKEAKKKSLELRSQIQNTIRHKFPQFFTESKEDQNFGRGGQQKDENNRKIEQMMIVNSESNI